MALIINMFTKPKEALLGLDPGRTAAANSDGERQTNTIHHPPLTWKAILMGLVVSIGGLIFGYESGDIAGFLAMSNFRERFGTLDPTTGSYVFRNVRSGLLVGMLSIGNLCGALIAGPMADRIGRRLSVSGSSIVYAIGLVVQLSSDNKWYQVALGRWTGGLAVGALSILVPLYQSETSPTHYRGLIVCLFQLFITVGILLANIINYGTESMNSSASWRITMGIGFFWALTLGLGMLCFPESPKYDYRNGRVDKARETMANLLGVPQDNPIVTGEIQEMKRKFDAEHAGSHQWREILTGPRMLHRTLLGIAFISFQQLTGANFFIYYGTTVFAATGLDNSYVTQIILGIVNVTCTFPGLYFAQNFSRRRCLVWGALWMCMCFLVFASLGHVVLDRTNPAKTPQAAVAMIVFACLFIAAFASTWGPMSWGECASLYPARHRAVCMGAATGANWFWNFMLAFFTPFLTTAIDYRYGYVFAGCCLAMAATVYFFLVESYGRTLEVDAMYVLHVLPRKSGTWTILDGED